MLKKISVFLLLFAVISFLFFYLFPFKEDTEKTTISLQENDLRSIPPFPTLTYHELTSNTNEVKPTVMHINEFKKQMKLLKENNYIAITDDDLLRFKYNGYPIDFAKEKIVHITFDMGYKSTYKLAAPVLAEFNLPATIFLTTKAMTDSSYIKDVNMLSWEDISELDAQKLSKKRPLSYLTNTAFSFQNYTHSLAYKIKEKGYEQPIALSKTFSSFAHSSPLFIAEDIETASTEIEKRKLNEVVSISYPFGVSNDDFVSGVRSTDLIFGYTLDNQLTDFSSQNKLKLSRIDVQSGLDDTEFLSLLTKKQ